MSHQWKSMLMKTWYFLVLTPSGKKETVGQTGDYYEAKNKAKAFGTVIKTIPFGKVVSSK